MKAIAALCKAELISLLYSLNFINKKKKKPFNTLFVCLFSIGLMAYIGIAYALPLASIMIPLGLDFVYWSQMVLMALVLCLSFTFLSSSSMLFSGKDMDFLFALPLSSHSILGCKLTALYLENLLLASGLLIPSGFVYGAHREVSFPFVMALLLACLTMPLFSTTLNGIIGFLVTAISSRLKFKKLFSIVLSILSMFILFKLIFSWQFSVTDPTQLSSMPNKFWAYLLPLKWVVESLSAQTPLKLVPFILLSVGFLGGFLLLFAPFYQNLVFHFANQTSKTTFKMKHQLSGSYRRALLKKEAIRFFNTPVYLLNCGLGVIMMALAGGYLMLHPQSLQEMLQTIGWSYGEIALALCSASGFFIAIAPASAVSISLEHQALWLLQAAPLSSLSILLTKVLFSWLIPLPGILIFFAGCQVAFGLPVPIFLLCIVFCLLCALLTSLIGIIVNLHLPRLDVTNDTIIIKQSGSVMVTMLINIVIILGFGGIGVLLPLPSPWVLLCFIVLFALGSWGLLYYLKKHGTSLFIGLTEQ